VTRCALPATKPTPEEIALAFDALVQALWQMWDQAEAGAAPFADQIADALGEMTIRPGGAECLIRSDPGSRRSALTRLLAVASLDGDGGVEE
jgi:hypothetical protein